MRLAELARGGGGGGDDKAAAARERADLEAELRAALGAALAEKLVAYEAAHGEAFKYVPRGAPSRAARARASDGRAEAPSIFSPRALRYDGARYLDALKAEGVPGA